MNENTLFRCGYCGELFSREESAEICPKREAFMPHAMGNLHKQITTEGEIKATTYYLRCQTCQYIFFSFLFNTSCPLCKSKNIEEKGEVVKNA